MDLKMSVSSHHLLRVFDLSAESRALEISQMLVGLGRLEVSGWPSLITRWLGKPIVS
jgi:hypothetical protein